MTFEKTSSLSLITFENQNIYRYGLNQPKFNATEGNLVLPWTTTIYYESIVLHNFQLKVMNESWEIHHHSLKKKKKNPKNPKKIQKILNFSYLLMESQSGNFHLSNVKIMSMRQSTSQSEIYCISYRSLDNHFLHINPSILWEF